MIALIIFCPPKTTDFSVIKPLSFPKAISDPQKVTAPMIPDAAVAIENWSEGLIATVEASINAAPATSVEIAEGAKLNERYVREWLGAMVTGEVVLYSPQTDRYELPAEHAACLTRAATPINMAAKAQFIGLLASVEDQVVDCFKNGGGVPYSAYPRFQEVMAEDTGQIILQFSLCRI